MIKKNIFHCQNIQQIKMKMNLILIEYEMINNRNKIFIFRHENIVFFKDQILMQKSMLEMFQQII